jgi:mRNA interferase RelE/StbE
VSYRIELSRQAARYLRRLNRSDQERMAHRIDQIAADPYGPHTKPLTNLSGRRAARVGAYRLVFAVDEAARLVAISDIGPRGQTYRRQ